MTATPRDLADRIWDVLVIGAGPAGGMAARTAAVLGRSVLVVDRSSFPRDKVCGCCLNPRAVRLLREAGLDGLLASAPTVDRVRLATRRRHATLAMPRTVVLSRAAVDAALIAEAARAGAVFLPATSAAADDDPGAFGADHRTVSLRRGRVCFSVPARIVIVATGLAAGPLDRELPPRVRPRSRIGLAAMVDDAAGVIPGLWMCSGRHGYVGMVELETGRLNVAAAIDPVFVRHAGGPAAAVNGILGTAAAPVADALRGARFRGTPLLTRSRSAVGSRRLLLAGDAAGYVEPFTGEGIAWALATGRGAANCAAQAIGEDWSAARLLTAWTDAHRRLVRDRQRSCRGTALALRCPPLVTGVIGATAWLPSLAAPVVRRILGAAPDGLPAA